MTRSQKRIDSKSRGAQTSPRGEQDSQRPNNAAHTGVKMGKKKAVAVDGATTEAKPKRTYVNEIKALDEAAIANALAAFNAKKADGTLTFRSTGSASASTYWQPDVEGENKTGVLTAREVRGTRVLYHLLVPNGDKAETILLSGSHSFMKLSKVANGTIVSATFLHKTKSKNDKLSRIFDVQVGA